VLLAIRSFNAMSYQKNNSVVEEDKKATIVVDHFVLVFHLFRGDDKEVVGFRNFVYVIAVQRTFFLRPRGSVNFHLETATTKFCMPERHITGEDHLRCILCCSLFGWLILSPHRMLSLNLNF
jgi:hypothetical protein